MMRKNRKRICALLLTGVLLLSLLPAAALAAEPAPCTKTEGCTLADGHEGECVTDPQANDSLVKTIVSWTFADGEFLSGDELSMPGVSAEHPASFDDVVSMLPTQISAEIEGEEGPAIVDLDGWSCNAFQEEGSGWPISGDYIFAAALPEGYACDPLPTVRVTLGGTSTFDLNNTLTKGGVTVAATDGGEVAYTEGDGFTLKSDGNYTVSGTWSGSLTSSAGSDHHVITVPSGVTASVTLDSVTIDVHDTDYAGAFLVAAGGKVNLNLLGTSTLTSGHSCAGLQVPENAEVTLDGSGKLMSTGGLGGAGIGGGGNSSNRDGGTITISGGTVEATGGIGGAGIGGGIGGDGGSIKISGGTVTAISGGTTDIGGGAGIGGGDNVNQVTGGGTGSGGTVSICGQGTAVTATGGGAGDYYGHDVGSGRTLSSNSSGSLSVTDGATLVMKNTGTDVTNPEYKGCTIIGQDGIEIPYDSSGKPLVVKWDGQSDKSAGALGVSAGGTILITGSNAGGGATLTIDVDNVTVTSGGRAVSGLIVRVDSDVASLTIKDLNLTARDVENAITFASDATLTVEGTCSLTGGSGGSVDRGYHAFYGNGSLTVQVGDASLTAVGGASSATFFGGTGLSADTNLTVKVGSKGCLRAVGGGSGDNGGHALIGKASVTVRNDGAVWAESGKAGGVFSRNGIYSGGDITLTGSGSTTAKGCNGITTGGTLTVDGTGTVTAEGTNAGVYFQYGSGYQLVGAGTLTAAGIGGAGISNGVYVSGDLELAFTGSLTAHGGSGTAHIGTNDVGMFVNDDLTVSEAPKFLDIQPGKGPSGYALSYFNFVNHSGIPDGVFVRGSTTPVVWPACAVAYAAPDKDGGTVPETVYRKANTDVTVPGNPGNLTRSGYVFAGWEYAGTTYAAGQTFLMPDHDVILTARWNANSTGGGGGSYTPSAPKDSYQFAGDSIRQEIPRSDLRTLADAGKRLTLSCDKAGMAFEPAALKAILAAVPATVGSVTFAAAPADLSGFPDAAALIGSRPAYDFTISYRDGKDNAVTAGVDFPAGSAAVTLTYSKTAAETEGSLFLVCVDEKGAVTRLDQSGYDGGKVRADAPHFSISGVACEAPAPEFTDIEGHWAEDDILFVASRGLLNGTGDRVFSPNAGMTRGMFVTALYRLAGNPQAAGEGGAFTDVPADAYYAPAVNWAAGRGIVSGTTAATFAPDRAVTRQEMAAIMVNYAKAMDYTLPRTREAVIFADNDRIAVWAADAVKAMQMAGILMGKDGNRFDPQGTATRAEVSAVLHRYVELVADPAAAQGRDHNDSGEKQ